MKRRRGQSTLEYILVLTAVLIALIVAAASSVGPGVQNTMNQAGNVVQKASNKVVNGLKGLN